MKTSINLIFALFFTALMVPASGYASLSFDVPSESTKINLQNASMLSASGNCDEAGEFIDVTVGNMSPLRASCVSTGNGLGWSINNISVMSQSDGPIAFVATKVSAPSTFVRKTLIKDTLAPMLILNAPKNGDSILSTNVSTFAVNGICSEAGQPISVTMKRAVPDVAIANISQQINCPVSRSWSMTFDLRSLGDNTDVQLIAIHTDANGNQAIQSSSYYMDVQAISTGFSGLPDVVNTSNAASLLLNGACNKEGAYISLTATIEGTNYEQDLTTNCQGGRWSFNNLSFAGNSVPEGKIKLALSLLNPLTGQMSTTYATVSKDITPPTLSVANPASGYRMSASTGSSITVSGSCSENGAAINITGALTTTVTCTEGAYSKVLDFSAQPDGDKLVTLTLADAAQNSVSQSFSFNKDVLPATLSVNPLTVISSANAASVVLSGSCSEYGNYAQPVQITGSVNATAACNAPGVWSLNLSSVTLADGNLNFTVNHKDAAGNAAPQVSVSVTKDTLPPTMAITSPALPAAPAKFIINQANSSSLVFKGTCDDSTAIITLSKGGTAVGSGSCASGAWTISSNPSTWADGDISLRFLIADPVGNSRQQDVIINKDATAPALTLAQSSLKINAASAANITLNGTCSESGALAQSVKVTGIGTTALTAACQAGNTWTLSVAKTAFAEGTSSIQINHADYAGNNAPTITVSVNKDLIPPTLTLATASGSTAINAASAASFGLKGTCSENGTAVNITGAATSSAVCTSGAWAASVNLGSLADGQLSFTASHSDAAGNLITQSLVVSKDTTLPTLAVTSPAAGTTIAAGTNFTITGTCSENGRAVAITGGLTASPTCSAGAWTYTYSGTVLSGSLNLALGHSDAAGNSVSVVFSMGMGSPSAYKKVVAGYNHTCGITNGGAVKCWGYNSYGQLGNGTTVLISGTPGIIDAGVVYSQIAAAGSHTCGITTAGAVKCWGDNSYFQLGNGTTVKSNTPVSIDAGVVYKQIAAGSMHTCGITTAGAVKCWGYNGNGQLGNGTTVKSNTPVSIDAGVVYSQIAAGGNHTCGITNVGAVKCWGLNSFGQLGNGTTVNSSTPVSIDAGVVYSQIAAAAGGNHTCGITTAGAVKCWGNNGSGQLGNGTIVNSNTPVSTDAGVVYSQITAGGGYTCGITTAGAVKCWGNNGNGQIGNGRTGISITPLSIDAGVVYSQITAGSMHTCGITTAGAVKCWGDNYYGQIGNGKFGDGSSFTPVGIDAGVVYSQITAAPGTGNNTCGITTAGAVKCWGDNTSGQLGNGAIRNSSTPLSTDAGVVYSQITAGRNHTCGITTEGAVKCWGYNGYGQFGNGTTVNSSTHPVSTNAGFVYSQITAGNYYTCGITTAGAVKCWGYNGYGQLGNGTTGGNSSTPVSIDAGVVYSQITAGSYHTCGITTAGAVKCWGYNSNGQLGNGTTGGNSSTPVSIDAGVVYSQITAGGSHTCGITTEGAVKCWGYNGFGQLGNGTTGGDSSTPVSIDAGVVYSQITAGSYHTCGITTAGAVKCWGYNGYGQLGIGPYGNSNLPVSNSNLPVSIDSGVVYSKIKAGNSHTCGITNAGALKCWGNNLYGQMGNGDALITVPTPILQ